MLVLNIYVKPYLAEYARQKYPSPIKDVAQFPAASLVNHAIVNSLIKQPVNPAEHKGNLLVMVNERICDLKDLETNNYLNFEGENNVSDKLLLDFDMSLHSYMGHQRYRYGIDYKDSVKMFIDKYHLTGLVTPEALLKKHVRWKKKVDTWRAEGVQLKMKFDK